MCHERWLRREERSEYGRGERLWDLFYRETKQPAPPAPMAERDAESELGEPEREEVMTGTPRRATE
jgi:hypothetical protein